MRTTSASIIILNFKLFNISITLSPRTKLAELFIFKCCQDFRWLWTRIRLLFNGSFLNCKALFMDSTGSDASLLAASVSPWRRLINYEFRRGSLIWLKTTSWFIRIRRMFAWVQKDCTKRLVEISGNWLASRRHLHSASRIALVLCCVEHEDGVCALKKNPPKIASKVH